MFRRKSAIEIKTPDQLAVMRQAGLVVARALAAITEAAAPGVTTGELDSIARDVLADHGATSSFLGYKAHGAVPYPGVICASVNDEVVHGIPGRRVIREGMLVSVDAGAILDGYHGDAARTFHVGEPPAAVATLLATTRLALMAGIAAARPGARIRDVSGAVEDVAVAAGLGIVRECVGHGIGTAMHEPPDVPNYRGRSAGMRLEVGHTLAIEPMLTIGSPEVGLLDDGWTIVSRDGSLACHFEHSIAITSEGPRILTTV